MSPVLHVSIIDNDIIHVQDFNSLLLFNYAYSPNDSVISSYFRNQRDVIIHLKT